MRIPALIPVCAVALLAMPTLALAQNTREYEVSVTNATRGETFTPLAVLTHQAGIRLFQIGSPAPAVLEAVAEEGNVAPLVTLAQSVPAVVYDAQTSGAPPAGVTAPGATTTMRVMARASAQLTLVAMLIPSNDAFVALNGIDLPNGFDPMVVTPGAYDAGTEVNDELCASIPGPNYPECGGPGGGGAPSAGGEGFVHVHAGIHGVGDFAAAKHDWRNPVAQIVIRRVR